MLDQRCGRTRAVLKKHRQPVGVGPHNPVQAVPVRQVPVRRKRFRHGIHGLDTPAQDEDQKGDDRKDDQDKLKLVVHGVTSSLGISQDSAAADTSVIAITVSWSCQP